MQQLPCDRVPDCKMLVECILCSKGLNLQPVIKWWNQSGTTKELNVNTSLNIKPTLITHSYISLQGFIKGTVHSKKEIHSLSTQRHTGSVPQSNPTQFKSMGSASVSMRCISVTFARDRHVSCTWSESSWLPCAAGQPLSWIMFANVKVVPDHSGWRWCCFKFAASGYLCETTGHIWRSDPLWLQLYWILWTQTSSTHPLIKWLSGKWIFIFGVNCPFKGSLVARRSERSAATDKRNDLYFSADPPYTALTSWPTTKVYMWN